MEGVQEMEFNGLQNTREGGVVWCFKKKTALEKRPPALPKASCLIDMMREHERRLIVIEEQQVDRTGNDENWSKKLRKIAKCLIKIKNEKPSTFNEEVV